MRLPRGVSGEECVSVVSAVCCVYGVVLCLLDVCLCLLNMNRILTRTKREKHA